MLRGWWMMIYIFLDYYLYITYYRMKYKHKKLWWIAKPSEDKNTTYYVEWHYWVIFKELIENSNDRELQSEKDWMEDCAIKIWQVFSIDATPETDVIIDIIDWCMPKITEE